MFNSLITKDINALNLTFFRAKKNYKIKHPKKAAYSNVRTTEHKHNTDLGIFIILLAM